MYSTIGKMVFLDLAILTPGKHKCLSRKELKIFVYCLRKRVLSEFTSDRFDYTYLKIHCKLIFVEISR